MASQELGDMIYNIKEKLTDKEFKDIMDKLAIKNKEEEGTIYEVRYIKQKRKLTYSGGGLFYEIEPKYKLKKVKVLDGEEMMKTLIDEMIEMINENKEHKIPPLNISKKNGEYYFEFAVNPIIWCNNPYTKTKCDCGNCESDDDECEEGRAKQRGCYVGFRDVLILSIEKI